MTQRNNKHLGISGDTQWTDCLLGDLFDRRMERGIAGLTTLSVTLNDGLVERSVWSVKMKPT